MNKNKLNAVLDPIIFDPQVRNYNNDDPLHYKFRSGLHF